MGALRTREIVGGAVGVTLAAVLLWWSFHGQGTRALAEALGHLSLAALLPALLCEAVIQASKALKWTALLSGLQPVRYRSALAAVVAGAASTHLVPLRLDEVVRAALLGRREGLPTAAVLGTVAVDRALEVLVAGVLLGAVALGPGLPPWMRLGAGILWTGFAALALGMVLFVRTEGAWGAGLERSNLPGVASLLGVLRSLAQGLRALPRGRALGTVLLGTAGEWGGTLAFYSWMLHVFEVRAEPALALVMGLANTVAYAVPNVPGALGTYEALETGVLEHAAALPHSTALALALAAHGILMVPVTLAGIGVGLVEWRRGRGPLPSAHPTER